MAKSKKVRRSSIRHMAADDAFTVLEALERAEQQEQPVAPDGSATDDESASDDELPEGAPA